MKQIDQLKRPSSLDVSEQELAQISAAFTKLFADYFANVSERDVFPSTYAGKATEIVDTSLPIEGVSVNELIRECESIVDLSRHNGHPRFFGYVASPSTPVGAYADLIASTLNANVTCWRSAPGPTEIERLVVRWLGQLIKYDDNSSGLLTSGGSMANLIAVLIASRKKAGNDVAQNGFWNSDSPLTLYASSEVHMSIPKAADILGLGRSYVRIISCDERLRVKVDELREQIRKDIQDNLRPFCIVGNAGTVATGVVDPLTELAAVAKEFDLWFHVDGAYGAPATLSPDKRKLFEGLELADSVSLDPHKWLYIPVDAGSLLFRDEVVAATAFNLTDADYIRTHGLNDEAAFAFWNYGVELSRRFRALKVWLTLRYYGTRRLAAAVSEDMALAEHLGSLISELEDFELLAPVELSICCFRYVPSRLRNGRNVERELNELNEKIMTGVQKSGRAYISNATINGKFALRVCITNFRTTRSDIEQTLNVIRDIARMVGNRER